jgi:hypothetical protein
MYRLGRQLHCRSNTASNRKRKATPQLAARWLKVEAAGIEPASRDISMTASTCVVG